MYIQKLTINLVRLFLIVDFKWRYLKKNGQNYFKKGQRFKVKSSEILQKKINIFLLKIPLWIRKVIK